MGCRVCRTPIAHCTQIAQRVIPPAMAAVHWCRVRAAQIVIPAHTLINAKNSITTARVISSSQGARLPLGIAQRRDDQLVFLSSGDITILITPRVPRLQRSVLLHVRVVGPIPAQHKKHEDGDKAEQEQKFLPGVLN